MKLTVFLLPSISSTFIALNIEGFLFFNELSSICFYAFAVRNRFLRSLCMTIDGFEIDALPVRAHNKATFALLIPEYCLFFHPRNPINALDS